MEDEHLIQTRNKSVTVNTDTPSYDTNLCATHSMMGRVAHEVWIEYKMVLTQ